jgi:hypothetical protein
MKKSAIIIGIIVVVVGIGIYLSRQPDSQSNLPPANDLSSAPDSDHLLSNMRRAGIEPLPAEGTVMHIHQHLDININGTTYTIPAQLGIASFFSPIHTHDTSGIIHVESPQIQDFKLSQFFDEWGVTFSDTCIATFCADQNNKLVVGVNGASITGVRNYVLKAHDEIEVWYGPKTQNPSLIKSYDFPAGL